MKVMYAVIVLVLLSCNNSNNDNTAKGKDSNISLHDSGLIKEKVYETEKLYDSSIYASYVPVSLKEYLDKEVTGWSIPAPAKWESYWFNQYKKDSSLVNFLTSDFNCDGKKDYALILREKKGTLSSYAIVSNATGFSKHKLEDLGEEMDKIGTGLELVLPATIHHIDDSDGEPPSLQLKCPAIQIIWFEQAARTFYWEKNKFKYVQTGD
jgi:hypothetical protein